MLIIIIVVVVITFIKCHTCSYGETGNEIKQADFDKRKKCL